PTTAVSARWPKSTKQIKKTARAVTRLTKAMRERRRNLSSPTRSAIATLKRTASGIAERTQNASPGVNPFKKVGFHFQYSSAHKELDKRLPLKTQNITAGNQLERLPLDLETHTMIVASLPRLPIKAPKAMDMRDRLMSPWRDGPSNRAIHS